MARSHHFNRSCTRSLCAFVPVAVAASVLQALKSARLSLSCAPASVLELEALMSLLRPEKEVQQEAHRKRTES